ncbi:DUF922 domain-containing protein [Roseivirga echinicomitans]
MESTQVNWTYEMVKVVFDMNGWLSKLCWMIFGAAIAIPASGQMEASIADETMIEWSDSRPLEWKDYTYRQIHQKGSVALTNVKHSVKGYLRNGLPVFEIKVLFRKPYSWTSDTTNLELLGHEQLHFDIAELYRRKIEHEIIKLQKKQEKKAAVYRAEIKRILGEFNVYSRRYDKESNHGMSKPEQERWKEEVMLELKQTQNN